MTLIKSFNINLGHNLSSSSLEANSSPEIDVEKIFLHSDVQNILTRITGYDLDKIFPVVPSAGKEQMKIELMTKLEVEKVSKRVSIFFGKNVLGKSVIRWKS